MIFEQLILASHHWGNCHLHLLRFIPYSRLETGFEVCPFRRLPSALASSFASTAFVAFIKWASSNQLRCSHHSWPSFATVVARAASAIASCSFAFEWLQCWCSYSTLEPLVMFRVRLMLMGLVAAAWATHRARWQLASNLPCSHTGQKVNRQRYCVRHDLYLTHSNCVWNYHRKNGPSQPSCSYPHYLNCCFEWSGEALAWNSTDFVLKMLCFTNESTFVCLALCLSLLGHLDSHRHHLQDSYARRSY